MHLWLPGQSVLQRAALGSWISELCSRGSNLGWFKTAHSSTNTHLKRGKQTCLRSLEKLPCCPSLPLAECPVDSQVVWVFSLDSSCFFSGAKLSFTDDWRTLFLCPSWSECWRRWCTCAGLEELLEHLHWGSWRISAGAATGAVVLGTV